MNFLFIVKLSEKGSRSESLIKDLPYSIRGLLHLKVVANAILEDHVRPLN